jgi:hypothetical protein
MRLSTFSALRRDREQFRKTRLILSFAKLSFLNKVVASSEYRQQKFSKVLNLSCELGKT